MISALAVSASCMAHATADYLVQTDLMMALKSFAATPAQRENWHGFSLYCMMIATNFISDFRNVTGKDCAANTPAELTALTLRQSTSLTLSEIKNHAEGRAKHPDYVALKGALSATNASKTLTDQLTKAKEDLKQVSDLLAQEKAQNTTKIEQLNVENKRLSTLTQQTLDKIVETANMQKGYNDLIQQTSVMSTKSGASIASTLADLRAAMTAGQQARVDEVLLMLQGVAASAAVSATPDALTARIAALEADNTTLRTSAAQLRTDLDAANAAIATLRTGSLTLSNDSQELLKNLSNPMSFKSKLTEQQALFDVDTKYDSLTADLPGETGTSLVKICKFAMQFLFILNFVKHTQEKGICDTVDTVYSSWGNRLRLHCAGQLERNTVESFVSSFFGYSSMDDLKAYVQFKKTFCKDTENFTVKLCTKDLSNDEWYLADAVVKGPVQTPFQYYKMRNEYQTLRLSCFATHLLCVTHVLSERLAPSMSHLHHHLSSLKEGAKSLGLNVDASVSQFTEVLKKFLTMDVTGSPFPWSLFHQGMYLEQSSLKMYNDNMNKSITVTALRSSLLSNISQLNKSEPIITTSYTF